MLTPAYTATREKLFPLSFDSGVLPLSENSIGYELNSFLESEIKLWQPDLIVLVERKATAIFRALNDDPSMSFKWDWEKTISSSSILRTDSSFFENKRILIFDDMMNTGHHLFCVITNIVSKIGEKALDQIRKAVFAIHRSSPGLSNKQCTSADGWYYRDLSSNQYRNLRELIIQFLESNGSLLLDTEHIEIRVRLKSDLSDLIEALNRNGKTVLVNSSPYRKNITVYYEQNISQDNFFPAGTDFSNIVKKCRVVQRRFNEFAIIPICYPSIPINKDAIALWAAQGEIQRFFDGPVNTNEHAPFYATGLFAALEVLKITLKDLAASEFDGSQVSLPLSNKEATSDGYTLGHLRVMFPSINLRALTEEISSIFSKTWSEGKKLSRKRHSHNKLLSYDTENLFNQAIYLLQLINDKLDRRIYRWYELYYDGINPAPHPFGLTAKEIFDLAEQLNIKERAIVSSLFDILIDRAFLVTHVENRLMGNEQFLVRTFQPDGEVVSRFIRELTNQYGLPLLSSNR